ncbi:hypothetical protein B0F90DRAFT_1808253 [Multifurca ochricompacta]|uniref:Uncharacterized protein n=1 Tax=Multifurca ochricompacta TaxID=376703 RepID=A0AAD4MA16_9AGAM|nr:hypothetical protein B0F90DRAFT_1808253 [Multifurca ochricompacta]
MAVEPFLGTRAQRFFIATKAVAVLAIISLVFRLVAEHVDLNKPNYKTIPCYLALFVLAEIFELLMAFDALRLRNVIQLAGILMFHVALVVFAAIQVHETRAALVRTPNCDGSVNYVTCGGRGTLYRKVEHLLIVVPCVIAAAWFIMIFFVRALYYEFGWAIFRIVGANPAMKTMYQFYQVLICLLKFDFFAFTGVTIQLLIVVLSRNSAEFGLTIAAIPVVLMFLIGCGIAVKREIKWLMTFSLFLMLASETYCECQYVVSFGLIDDSLLCVPVYKLVRFYEPGSEEQYETTRATLTVFTIVSILLLLTTFGVGLRCFYDFEKGLYESKTSDTLLLQPKRVARSNNPGEKPNALGQPLEPRMSIE